MLETGSHSPRDEVLQRALALAPDDRAFVAEALEESLPPAEFATPEIAAAWSAEIDRRIAAYDRGETTAVSFDAALDHLRQALAERRAQVRP